MYEDSGVRLLKLKVDGGMATNKLFVQMLANIVGIQVSTPSLCETTALGVALAAGKAKGIDLFRLDNENEIKTHISSYTPRIQGHGSTNDPFSIRLCFLLTIDVVNII
jgi:glycerol kinase